jgi:hypothetical protein
MTTIYDMVSLENIKSRVLFHIVIVETSFFWVKHSSCLFLVILRRIEAKELWFDFATCPWPGSWVLLWQSCHRAAVWSCGKGHIVGRCL